VGRLCNGFVYANGVNGGDDEDSPFYGARNAFDDGQNVVKGIQYSSWESGKKSDGFGFASASTPARSVSRRLSFARTLSITRWILCK
jgi:hypothetical protein